MELGTPAYTRFGITFVAIASIMPGSCTFTRDTILVDRKEDGEGLSILARKPFLEPVG